jgi:hypothetical protein
MIPPHVKELLAAVARYSFAARYSLFCANMPQHNNGANNGSQKYS